MEEPQPRSTSDDPAAGVPGGDDKNGSQWLRPSALSATSIHSRTPMTLTDVIFPGSASASVAPGPAPAGTPLLSRLNDAHFYDSVHGQHFTYEQAGRVVTSSNDHISRMPLSAQCCSRLMFRQLEAKPRRLSSLLVASTSPPSPLSPSGHYLSTMLLQSPHTRKTCQPPLHGQALSTDVSEKIARRADRARTETWMAAAMACSVVVREHESKRPGQSLATENVDTTPVDSITRARAAVRKQYAVIERWSNNMFDMRVLITLAYVARRATVASARIMDRARRWWESGGGDENERK